MNTSIYDKTDKGREEIATRRHRLAPRLRTLLVMVDGRRPDDELLKNVAGLGLDAGSLRELLEQDFIVLSRSYSTMADEPEMADTQDWSSAEPEADVATLPQASTAAPQVEQFQSLYNFYNQTIKSTIGLRGFTLQLKVERAASVDELRELRRPYLEAVLKVRGADIARKLRGQLDQLLGGRPAGDDLLLPGD